MSSASNTPATNGSSPFKIQGDWSELSKKLQAKYPKLEDSDLKLAAGQEEDLLQRIQGKLDKSREEVVSILKEVQ